MTEIVGGFLGKIFAGIFGSHSILATILISMFPIIELKGAIPIGQSSLYWGEYALSDTQSFLFSALGSCLVVPILALVFKPILNWLKKTKLFKKIATFIEEKVKKHTKDIDEKVDNAKEKTNKTLLKCFLIFGFVAIPLPLTGVWTGTCVAVLIGLKYWQILVSVIPGNIVAGLIIWSVCKIFPGFEDLLSIIFVAMVLVLIIILVVKFILHTIKKDDNITNESIENNDN